jgi:hypothetical protein
VGGDAIIVLVKRLMPRLLILFALGLGCGGQPWQPAPPRGMTYEYDYQGFQSASTTVVGGSRYGFPAYGGAFAFRDEKGVHNEVGGKDPFVQSQPINGVQFNAHLGKQGAQVKP